MQGAHAGLKMSYFSFSIYKAIRKVLFFRKFGPRLIKVLFEMLLNFSKFWISFFLQRNVKTFSNQQTSSLRFKSAFQLFDEMLCKQIQCLDLTHSKV